MKQPHQQTFLFLSGKSNAIINKMAITYFIREGYRTINDKHGNIFVIHYCLVAIIVSIVTGVLWDYMFIS